MMSSPLAGAYLAMGDLENAESAVRRGLEAANARNLPPQIVVWLNLQGMVLAAQGRFEAAEASFEEAIQRARHMGAPYDEADAHKELGIALARAGDTERARAELQAAHATFERLGAMPDLDRTEQALAGLQPS